MLSTNIHYIQTQYLIGNMQKYSASHMLCILTFIQYRYMYYIHNNKLYPIYRTYIIGEGIILQLGGVGGGDSSVGKSGGGDSSLDPKYLFL